MFHRKFTGTPPMFSSESRRKDKQSRLKLKQFLVDIILLDIVGGQSYVTSKNMLYYNIVNILCSIVKCKMCFITPSATSNSGRGQCKM